MIFGYKGQDELHPITSYKFLQGLQNEFAYSTIEAQDGIFNGNLIVNGRIQDKGILPADINWDNIAPGNYYVTNTSFSTNSSNYPLNAYQWGILIITNLSDGNAIFKLQRYYPHFSSSFYYRIYYSSEWKTWSTYTSNDYKSISLNSNGYIIFRNGLILQFKREIINTTTDGTDEIIYPISFPNNICAFASASTDLQINHFNVPILHNVTNNNIGSTSWTSVIDGVLTIASSPGQGSITLIIAGY